MYTHTYMKVHMDARGPTGLGVALCVQLYYYVYIKIFMVFIKDARGPTRLGVPLDSLYA